MGSPPSSSPLNPLFVPSSTPEFDETIQAMLELIARHERFVVVSHVHPDGDAIGATLAAMHMLELLGKTVIAYNRDPVPYNLAFLPGAERMVQSIPQDFDPEVTILLDCGEASRIGEDFPEHGWGGAVAVIDHHKSWDEQLAQVYVRDVSAAATGEVIYRIFVHTGLALTLPLAKALYCCLMTDTGSFRYSSTSRVTLQIAGELLEAGVDAWEMTSHLYESQPLSRMRLLAEVLATLKLSACGRLAFLRLDRQMFEATGATPEMADGFINFGRSIQGVEVSTQMTQLPDDSWKISLRSRGNLDVSLLAERLGGGGHRNAAGCTLHGDEQQVRKQLCEALSGLLD